MEEIIKDEEHFSTYVTDEKRKYDEMYSIGNRTLTILMQVRSMIELLDHQYNDHEIECVKDVTLPNWFSRLIQTKSDSISCMNESRCYALNHLHQEIVKIMNMWKDVKRLPKTRSHRTKNRRKRYRRQNKQLKQKKGKRRNRRRRKNRRQKRTRTTG